MVSNSVRNRKSLGESVWTKKRWYYWLLCQLISLIHFRAELCQLYSSLNLKRHVLYLVLYDVSFAREYIFAHLQAITIAGPWSWRRPCLFLHFYHILRLRLVMNHYAFKVHTRWKVLVVRYDLRIRACMWCVRTCLASTVFTFQPCSYLIITSHSHIF